MNYVDRVVDLLRNKYKIGNVENAIFVGSGLADSIPEIKNVKEVKYNDLGLAGSRVQGHRGSFIFGEINGKSVVLVSRIHFYECCDIERVRFPFEIVAALGVKNIILMTSCGGVSDGLKVGDILAIKDHINLSGFNPLAGIEKLTFTSMTNCYDVDFRKKLHTIADELGINLKDGVLCQMSGPSYETAAELAMIKLVGADGVTMSTAYDCIVARYLEMRVAGLMVIVNVANGINVPSHQEVLTNAKIAGENIKKILTRFL